MLRSIARFLSPYALLAILLATGVADPAHAQGFPTPSKTLCVGDPPATLTVPFTCTPTTPANSPSPGQAVFYAVTLGPSAPAGTFTLLETLPPPPDFTLLGAKCIVDGTSTTTPLTTISVSSATPPVTTLGSVTLPPQPVTCFIQGFFSNPGPNNPGGAEINSVTVADESGPVSSPVDHNAIILSNAPIPTDLTITKTVSTTSIDISSLAQPVTYTIVITNTGPHDVYIGPMFELFDRMHASNSVPMQVNLLPGSVQCTATPSNLVPAGLSPPNTSCLDPIPAATALPWADVTSAGLNFAKWQFPAGSPGYIPANGTITLTYTVEVRRNPDIICAKGGEALRNEAFFGNNRLPNDTFADNDASNNIAQFPDVPEVAVTTGQIIDPDCGAATPGPITIVKTQITPNPITWSTNVAYHITVTNSDPNPIVVRLRDQVLQWWGTPQFDAHVVNWTCTLSNGAPCVSPPPQLGAPVSLLSYGSRATAWDKTGITVPGTGTAQVDITLQYVRTSCDSFAAGDQNGNIIRNYGRADYVSGTPPAPGIAEAFVDTIMSPAPPFPCNFQVTKIVQDVDQVEFGAPPTPPLSYVVTYQNTQNFAVSVGTLIDAVRIVQPNYATQLQYTNGSYTCTATSGSVTNAPTPQSNLSGTIYHTQYPSQATRIIQNTGGPVIFGPNSTLTCNVSFNVLRPAPGDPFCRSSELDPSRLENLALMDVSQFYSSSVPWPPSGTYNASTPVTVAQPSPLANWSTVSVKLPKCYRLILNKRVNPGLTWAPGGPALNYTIDVTNAGDTLTGSPGTNGWNGLLLGDAFLPPFNFVPPASPAPSLVSMGYTCPPHTPALQVTLGPWSGAPAGNLSFLPVTSFPAGCTIHLTFQVAGTFKPSLPGQPLNQICNRAGAGMVPNAGTGGTDTADWYANIPNPNLLSMKVCVPVLQTNKLTIKKTLINNAGAVLPPGMTYPMSVSCTIPNPGGSPPIITTVSANINVAINGVSLPNSIPVGSTCFASEDWNQLPVPTESECKRPQVPAWQAPSYSPVNLQIVAPPADNIITVTNTLDCVTPPVNTLTVEKTFDPATVVSQLPPDAVFPVEVVCDPFPTGTLTLTATAWQQFMANIPVGTLCKIRELPPEGTKIPEDCKWVQTYPNGNDVVIPAQGNPTLVVQNALICKPDLAITKTGPTPTSMSGLYTFTITVTSPGGPFTVPSGALTVTDIFTGLGGVVGNMTATPSSDWDCLTSPGTCAYTGTGPTVAGQVLGTFTVSYFEYTPAAYVNCATVALPSSSGVLESNLNNNTACVRGGAAPPRVDLKIAKTGPVAVPGSSGIAAFTLTVTNAGPPFFLTPNSIAVTDSATGMIGSFTGISATPAGNWNCSVSGHTGTCAYPGFGAIATGQVLGTITITYHSWALANFRNCASVKLTINAPLQEANLLNNQACVTVSDIKRPPLCPDGKPVPKSGHCPVAPTECEPGMNEEHNDQGQCVCIQGYQHDKSGRCVEQTTPADECKAKGWVWNDKSCSQPTNPADECKAKGWVWNDKTKSCSQPTNPADECKAKGWVWDGERCLPPANPADECKTKGWVWNNKTKSCLPPPNLADECKTKGWVWNDKTKSCSPPTNPADECRKKGWVWDGKRCLSPADTCKAKGWVWDGARCLPPSSPADECKKKGWVWDGKRCLSPADTCKAKGWSWDGKSCQPPTSPADECRKKGWVWDGKRCSPPANPADECKKKGGVWDGERCLSPADTCKAKGWSWDGKNCQPPASDVPR